MNKIRKIIINNTIHTHTYIIQEKFNFVIFLFMGGFKWVEKIKILKLYLHIRLGVWEKDQGTHTGMKNQECL